MDTDTASGAATQTYVERTYPRFDCMGSYLWIWERLNRSEAGEVVVARRTLRDRTRETDAAA